MTNIVDNFRTKLSEELRAAMTQRNSEDVSTIRSLMAALDNAGALSKEEIAQLNDPAKSEVPRKKLTKEDIKAILNREIDIRNAAFCDFERLGNEIQSQIVKRSIATILRLSEMLK